MFLFLIKCKILISSGTTHEYITRIHNQALQCPKFEVRFTRHLSIFFLLFLFAFTPVFFRKMAKINRIFPYSSPSHFLLMKEFSLSASCTSWNQISSRNLQHCFPQQLECSILIRSIITISLLLPCPTFLLFCSNWLVLPKPAVRSEATDLVLASPV